VFDDSDWPDEPEDILRAAFEDGGPGFLQLKSEDKARILQEQYDFYHLIDLKMKTSYCAVLDRLVLYVQKAMVKAINGPKKWINCSTPNNMWKGLAEQIDVDLLESHLSDLHNECFNLYNKYHKTQKAASEQTLAKIDKERAIEDFQKLGNEFKKIFGPHEDLFLTQEMFKPFMITGYVPSIRGDEEAGALIEKYEELRRMGRAVSRRQILLDIEQKYWEIDDREKFHDILQSGIQYATLEHRTEDCFVLIERYAERLEEIEQWGGAITEFDKALEITVRFGKDNRYAKIKHKLIRCKIKQDTVGALENFGSDWYADLEECYEIFTNIFGNMTSRLDVLSTMVLFNIKKGEAAAAIQMIEYGRETNLDNFHPRGEAGFLFSCAKSLLNYGSSTNGGVSDVSEYGKKILNDAKVIQEKYGEKSDLIKTLELQCEHEHNPYTVTAIQNEISKLNSDIESLIAIIGQGDIEGNFVQHLVSTGFMEGIRLLRNSPNLYVEGVEIERCILDVADLKDLKISVLEGYSGTFWRHLNNSKSLKQDDALQELGYAEEWVSVIEALFDKLFPDIPISLMAMRMQLLEAKIKLTSRDERIEKNRELIEGWSKLQSKRGEYRWKNNLAKILTSEGFEQRNPEQIQEGEDLYDEVREFYKEKDASNYFFSSCDYIKNRCENDAENSANEWEELLKDPHIPNTDHIRIELYSRYAWSIKNNGDLEGALNIYRKGAKLILETGNIDEERHKLYLSILKSEVFVLHELGHYHEAEEKIDLLVDAGWLNKSGELHLRVKILRSNNEWEQAIELLREKFQYEKNKGVWKLASITLDEIGDIYAKQGLLDDAISALYDKIKYDSEYGEGKEALIYQSIAFQTIASYHENQEQWGEAKKAYWAKYKINKLQGSYGQKYWSLNSIRYLHYRTQDSPKVRIILWKMFHLSELQRNVEISSSRDAREDSRYVLDTITQSMFADKHLRYMGASFYKLKKLWYTLHFDNKPEEKMISEQFEHIVDRMKKHGPKIGPNAIDPREVLEVLFAWYNHSQSYSHILDHALVAADLIAELRQEQGLKLRNRVQVMMFPNTLDEEE